MLILGYSLSYLELFGSIFSLAAVILAAKGTIWNWPVGIIGQIFLFALFMNNHLYGQSILQIIFTGISLYGWYYWGKDIGKKIKRLSTKYILLTYSVMAILCLLSGYILSFYQPQFALMDASTLVMSMVAVILISKKILESWTIWILVDILSVILFASKGIYLMTIEYIIICFIATYGLINWIKLYKKQDG